MMEFIKKLHSIAGLPSTKLVYGAMSFFTFLGVCIYGTICVKENKKIDDILFFLSLMTFSLLGLSSVDLFNLRKKST